jgi:hypothetical protein
MIAIHFRMSKFAVWESYHRVEDGKHARASAQVIQKARRAPTHSFSPKKKNMWLLGSTSASTKETAPRRVKFATLLVIYSKGELITSGRLHESGGAVSASARTRNFW